MAYTHKGRLWYPYVCRPCTLVCVCVYLMSSCCLYTGDNHIPVAPTVAVVATKDPTSSSRSDSPCVDDDDSFADFLAREVHESALERRGSSSSRSPTPSLADITSRLQGGPGLSRFGVTASCPPAPVQLPDGSVNAVSHVHSLYMLIDSCHTETLMAAVGLTISVLWFVFHSSTTLWYMV